MPSPKKQMRKRSAKTSSKGKENKNSRIQKSAATANVLKELHKETLLLALNTTGLGIWDWDLQSNVFQWSDNIHNIFGYFHSAFKGTRNEFEKLIHPEDKTALFNTIHQAIVIDGTYCFVFRIIWPDNTVHTIESNGKILYNKNRQPIRVLSTIRDITKQKESDVEPDDWKIKFQLIAAASSIVIYDYDITTGSLLWEGNCLETLGNEATEVNDISQWIDRIHPDDRVEVCRNLEKAQQDLLAFEMTYRFRKKNHEYAHMYDRGLFIQNEAEEAFRMVGLMQNISRQKEVEQELQESEQRFRTLHEASFGGIAIHDKGLILDCNQGLCAITGYTRDELIGMNGILLLAVEHQDSSIEKIESGYEKPYDAEGVRKDGSRYRVEIQGKKIPYKGKVIRVTEFRNITDRKRVEESIVEQNIKLSLLTDELKKKNEQLEEFTQIVAHNLRSPISNTLTLLSFLEGAESEDEKQEYIKLLKESGSTTLSMFNDLNDVLQIKQAKNIEKQHLSFDKIYSNVRNMLSAKISEVSAEFICDFSLAPTLYYPSIYLESILLNLISNSLKYIKRHVIPVIEIRTYRYNSHIFLEVKDNGLGIDLEKYGHQVFKLRKTFHRHPESQGIGLFMIKNQIETMGGEITVSSKENEGSTFLINFNKHPVLSV